MTTTKPLRGLRILVPPSRLDRNPMVPMFERMGAEVVTFPALYESSVDPAPLDDVAPRLGEFDWIVIAGGGSVNHFFGRLNRLELDTEVIRSRDPEKGVRVGAIGFSALKALRGYGVEAEYRPRQHFADAVVAGMEPVRGRRVLLVRAAGATDALPKALRRQGAKVEALTGHAIAARSPGPEARPDAGPHPGSDAWPNAGSDAGQTFGRQGLDLAAFVNPATVRLFFEGLDQRGVGVERCLARVPIFAIGPATAESLVTAGLPPDHVAGGRLKLLLDDVIHLAGGGPRGRGI